MLHSDYIENCVNSFIYTSTIGLSLSLCLLYYITAVLAMVIVKHRRRMLATHINNKLDTAELAGPSWNYYLPGVQVTAEIGLSSSRIELAEHLS